MYSHGNNNSNNSADSQQIQIKLTLQVTKQPEHDKEIGRRNLPVYFHSVEKQTENAQKFRSTQSATHVVYSLFKNALFNKNIYKQRKGKAFELLGHFSDHAHQLNRNVL